MLLALSALVLVAVALVLSLLLPMIRRARRTAVRGQALRQSDVGDPGRERRAEHRARELLRSCVNEQEWAMYRDLGFIRVAGRPSGRARSAETADGDEEAPPYAYLIYPHKPIIAYVPASGRLLNEYCVEFTELGEALSGSRLPASDDVLAKWMALTGDERRLIGDANMHLPGRQLDPARVRRDLWRLARWERERGSGPRRDSLGTS